MPDAFDPLAPPDDVTTRHPPDDAMTARHLPAAVAPPDPRRRREALPSPCISLCAMDAQSGLCRGCDRTIDEIVGWSASSEERKRAIWLAIAARRAAAGKRA